MLSLNYYGYSYTDGTVNLCTDFPLAKPMEMKVVHVFVYWPAHEKDLRQMFERKGQVSP